MGANIKVNGERQSVLENLPVGAQVISIDPRRRCVWYWLDHGERNHRNSEIYHIERGYDSVYGKARIARCEYQACED